MSEDEDEQGHPKCSNTPDGDTLDAVVVAVVCDLHRALFVVLLGGFEATPDQVMRNPRHCSDEEIKGVKRVVEAR